MSAEHDPAQVWYVERVLASLRRKLRHLSPDRQTHELARFRLQLLRNSVVRARVLETPKARGALVQQIDELADLLGVTLIPVTDTHVAAARATLEKWRGRQLRRKTNRGA
jgi:hypothetical protein